MGLSTRILLRICLPSIGLVLLAGLLYHNSSRQQHLAMCEQQLLQAAATAAELIEDRRHELEGHLNDLLADRSTDVAALNDPATDPDIRATARERVAADGVRLLNEHRQFNRLALYDRAGRCVMAFAGGEVVDPVPYARYEPWFEVVLEEGRSANSFREDGRSMVRLAVRGQPSETSQPFVACGMIDPAATYLPLVEASSHWIADVGIQMKNQDGELLVQHGPPMEGQQIMAVSATPGAGGRIVLNRSQDGALAGMAGSESELITAIILLIGMVACLLWTGIRTSVLVPLRRMIRVVEAFSLDHPVPPEATTSSAKGELGELDRSLRSAILSFRETRHSLSELNETLELRVAQRTQELDGVAEQLRAAHGEASQLGQARAELVSQLSHEVLCQVGRMANLAQKMRQCRDEPGACRHANEVATVAEELGRYVSRVIDRTDIESGKWETINVDFNLKQVLEDLERELESMAGEKGLEISVSVGSDCPSRLRGDPGRLCQVLTLLAHNAIRFTERGSVMLQARLDPGTVGSGEADSSSQPGDLAARETAAIRFEVIDTGPGLSEDVAESLTEPTNMESTHDGLSLCQMILARLGGQLHVESGGAGQGTRARFSLPYRLPEGSREGSPPGTPYWELSGLSVLAVAPNAIGGRLRQLLVECGTLTECVATAEQALGAAQQAFYRGRPFHAVLVDESLDVNELRALSRGLASDPALCRLPLALMTDGPAPNSVAGYTACFERPDQTRAMGDALSRLVSGHALTPQPGHAPQPAVDSPPSVDEPVTNRPDAG
jgi:signal transduction histidine kinase